MGNLNFSLGKVQYDNLSLSPFPLEAQIGVGVGASIVALIVLIIVLIYRSVGLLCVCVGAHCVVESRKYKRQFYTLCCSHQIEVITFVFVNLVLHWKCLFCL